MPKTKHWLAIARQTIGRGFSSTAFLAVMIAVLLTGSGLGVFIFHASSDQVLPFRSLNIDNTSPGATTNYTLSFTIATADNLGSIKAQFCDNDPLVDDPCNAPAGFDVSSASIAAQGGQTGFSVGSGTDANNLILTRTTAPSLSQPVSYTLSGVVNPSAIGSYYVRVQTFASGDASGPRTDHGGLAFAINNNIAITSKVPPYLLFCSGVTITNYDCDSASGSYINFGNFSTASASSSQTQLVLATNAGGGYNIIYQGNTLTSGNNVIPPLATPDVSRPGVSQFGLNLVGNQDPTIGHDPEGPGAGGVVTGYNQANRYKFVPNDIIASGTTTSDYRKYTVSYVANIAKDQPAGVYVSTLTYVATANF